MNPVLAITFTQNIMIQKAQDLLVSRNVRIMTLSIELENAVDIAEAVLQYGKEGVSDNVLKNFVTRTKKLLDESDVFIRPPTVKVNNSD